MEDNFDINKEKCKELKKIRSEFAKELNVNLEQKECKYKGKCSGTCPQCQMEEELLNKALVSTGICVGVATTAILIGAAGLIGGALSNNKFNEVMGALSDSTYDEY